MNQKGVSMMVEESTKQETKRKIKRIRRVTKVKHPLPDVRSKFEQHFDIIKAYVVASNEGKIPVSWKDFKTLIDFNVQYVSGNNKFLENLGLIIRAEKNKGKYLPTNTAVELYNALKWKKEAKAKSILYKVLVSSWFFASTKQLLELKGSATERELLEKLGYDVEADPEKHINALKVLIEYMTFAALINCDNDTFTLLETPSEEEELLEAKDKESPPLKPKEVKYPPMLIGIMITPGMGEEDIRKAVRIILEEVRRIDEENE